MAARVVSVHGVVCTYTPEGGPPLNILGVFDNEYFDDTGGQGIQTTQAACRIATAQAPNIKTGEAFRVIDQNFTISIVKHDGAGMTLLALKRTT